MLWPATDLQPEQSDCWHNLPAGSAPQCHACNSGDLAANDRACTLLRMSTLSGHPPWLHILRSVSTLLFCIKSPGASINCVFDRKFSSGHAFVRAQTECMTVHYGVVKTTCDDGSSITVSAALLVVRTSIAHVALEVWLVCLSVDVWQRMNVPALCQ